MASLDILPLEGLTYHSTYFTFKLPWWPFISTAFSLISIIVSCRYSFIYQMNAFVKRKKMTCSKTYWMRFDGHSLNPLAEKPHCNFKSRFIHSCTKIAVSYLCVTIFTNTKVSKYAKIFSLTPSSKEL